MKILASWENRAFLPDHLSHRQTVDLYTDAWDISRRCLQSTIFSWIAGGFVLPLILPVQTGEKLTSRHLTAFRVIIGVVFNRIDTFLIAYKLSIWLTLISPVLAKSQSPSGCIVPIRLSL